MEEYTPGMIKIINMIMDQKSKSESLQRPEDFKINKMNSLVGSNLSENVDPKELVEEDDGILESEKIKVMEAFQHSMFANVNAATNNLSLISLKSKELQFKFTSVAQQQFISSRLVESVKDNIQETLETSERMLKVLS